MTWRQDILEVASMVVTWWIMAFVRSATPATVTVSQFWYIFHTIKYMYATFLLYQDRRNRYCQEPLYTSYLYLFSENEIISVTPGNLPAILLNFLSPGLIENVTQNTHLI